MVDLQVVIQNFSKIRESTQFSLLPPAEDVVSKRVFELGGDRVGCIHDRVHGGDKPLRIFAQQSAHTVCSETGGHAVERSENLNSRCTNTGERVVYEVSGEDIQCVDVVHAGIRQLHQLVYLLNFDQVWGIGILNLFFQCDHAIMIRLGERLEFRRRSERERSGKALIGDPKTDGFHELVVLGRFGCDLLFDLCSGFAFDEFLSGLDLSLLHQINVLVDIKRSRCIRYVFGQSTKDEDVFHVLAHVLNVVLLVDRNLFQLAGENGGHLVVLDVLAERRHFVRQIRLVRAPRFVGCSPSRLLIDSKGNQLRRQPGHECVARFRRRIERGPNTRDFLRVS